MAQLPRLLIGPGEPAPCAVRPGANPRLVVCCDHAGSRIPARLGTLGLSAEDLARHIAWDPGALAVAEWFAAEMGATLVAGVYSRLVMDLNRYPHDPFSTAAESDLTPVPGNTGLSAAERWRRVIELHRPYHDALAAELAARPGALLLSVHTMTDRPRASGRFRPEEIALSHLPGDPVAAAALAALRSDPGLAVGDNTPYGLDIGEDFTVPEHAVREGRPHLQLELRQDLLPDAEAAARWAARALPAVAAGLAAAGR
jgi:predicted N-formylglutamate amidohydrolase